jgi:acetylornithine/succinyldiaminopimelate/putrescine aminotransferase
MTTSHPFATTYEQILREELPNLFRLYVNPHVTQACFCLERYVQTTWGDRDDYQTFLANCFDEALGGAIKLARYAASEAGRPTTGLVLDAADRLGPFAGVSLPGGGTIEFVPGLTVVSRGDAPLPETRFGLVVLMAVPDGYADTLRRVIERDRPLVITCVDRAGLAALRGTSNGILREVKPDIVVFDESFVNRDVPFGAFTARRSLYEHWNKPGKTTFHSTTYQPNTVSSLHFLNCLEREDPAFHAAVSPELERIQADPKVRASLFRRLYSPSLLKATRTAGFDVPGVRAAGAFVYAGDRAVFDGVSGVACSIRGHNPPEYAREMEALQDVDCTAEVATRLRELTGLDCVLPAVSGATAVENALKIGLVAQYPRRHILALKAGFGGKTLFALTGTWNNSYKQHVGPLYPEVEYVDPFAPDATAQIDAALARNPVAVVQVELIQAVGGVRRIPDAVLRHLHERRQQAGYLLLIDEVQTGMYRTGPFTLSRELGLTPDLTVIGKGTSDMMVPFALVLHSADVQAKRDRAGSDLPAVLRQRYSYEFGYRSVLNVLRRAAELRLAERVAESGALFAKTLSDELRTCPAVCEVRAYGLLIGIELETRGVPRKWFGKKLFLLYVLNMLRHPTFPVLVGYCQYEPNVLKFTPPLTVTPEQVRAACATIVEVLRRPLYRLVAGALGSLVRSVGLRRRTHEHGKRTLGAAHELVSR